MLGGHSGLQIRVKQIVQDREILAAKSLLIGLNIVLKDVIQIFNFVDDRALNTSLFANLCSEMDAMQKNILYWCMTV